MKKRILICGIFVFLVGCATTTSPTGRRQIVGGISQTQLNQLGVEAFRQAKQQNQISSDPHQNAYAQCVVNAIVSVLPPQWRQMHWESAVFVNHEPNAFALPGGKVGINSGIFTVARNQDQFAAVIGHEMGHVISRHHEERITRQLGTEQGLAVLSELAGAAYGGSVANVVNQVGGLTAQTVFLLPGSRAQESEADIVGQRLMAQAGFDPAQAVRLWENMQALGNSSPPKWLATHPAPSNRMQVLKQQSVGLEKIAAQAHAAGRQPHCSL